MYTWAPDAVYGNASTPNATMTNWARENRLTTARYPAGEASYWNWEDPSGVMGRSTLDPSFNDSERAPGYAWMALDEYLDLCEAASLRPLIGVNYNCHGAWWVPRNESVARAERQVRHVVARGFPGALWYVGNEDDALQHGDTIAAHAHAMRAVDPTAKILFNDNGLQPKQLERFLSEVGDAIDGAEFHGKWPFGGLPDLPPATFAEWLEEVPLLERKSNQTWRDKLTGLRAAAKAAGRPELLLANNEFGLGKPSALVNFSRYTKSLVVVEFALEMYVAGYDVAAFWDNGDGGMTDHTDHMLLSTAAGYRCGSPAAQLPSSRATHGEVVKKALTLPCIGIHACCHAAQVQLDGHRPRDARDRRQPHLRARGHLAEACARLCRTRRPVVVVGGGRVVGWVVSWVVGRRRVGSRAAIPASLPAEQARGGADRAHRSAHGRRATHPRGGDGRHRRPLGRAPYARRDVRRRPRRHVRGGAATALVHDALDRQRGRASGGSLGGTSAACLMVPPRICPLVGIN